MREEISNQNLYPLTISLKNAPNNTSNGILIAIEGLDGAGKSTLAKNINTFFTNRGMKITTLRAFSGNTAYHDILIKTKELMNDSGCPLPREIDQTLYTMEFLTYAAHVLPELLNENDIVIADRYLTGRIALSRWDTCKTDSIPEQMLKHHINNGYIRKPDAIFYLNLTVEEALIRIYTRELALQNIKTISELDLSKLEEKEKPENLFIVKNELDKLLLNNKEIDGIYVINAMQNMEDLTGNSLKIIKNLINKRDSY